MVFRQSPRCSKFLKSKRGNNNIKNQLKKFVKLKSQVPPQRGKKDSPLSPPFNNKFWHYWLTGDLRLVYFYRDGNVFLCGIWNHIEIQGTQAPDITKILNKYLQEQDPIFWQEFVK